MRVKTYLAKSKIHGMGIFAAERIKAGTVVWTFTAGRDLVLTRAELTRTPKKILKFLQRYLYLSKDGDYILCCDNAKFFNHSKSPNTISSSGDTIAQRDIEIGEELLDDYTSFAEAIEWDALLSSDKRI